MTDDFKISQSQHLDDRGLLIVDLLDENDRLRAALADLGADYVILKVTLAKTIKALSDLRVSDMRRQLERQRVRDLVEQLQALQRGSVAA